MNDFFAIIVELLTGLLGTINSIVGWLIDIKIFGIPLLVFLATLDILAEIWQYLFNNINDDAEDDSEDIASLATSNLNEIDPDLEFDVDLQVIKWRSQERLARLRDEGFLRDQSEYERRDDLDV